MRDLAGTAEAPLLLDKHGVATSTLPQAWPPTPSATLRRFDASQKRVAVNDAVEPARQRAFQAGDAAGLPRRPAHRSTSVAAQATSASPEPRSLARIPAWRPASPSRWCCPTGRFLGAAEQPALRHRPVAHSASASTSRRSASGSRALPTSRRPRGVPFFFVRVDQAGNISQRPVADRLPLLALGRHLPAVERLRSLRAAAQGADAGRADARRLAAPTSGSRAASRATTGELQARRSAPSRSAWAPRRAPCVPPGLREGPRPQSDAEAATPTIGAGCKDPAAARAVHAAPAFPDAQQATARSTRTSAPREPYASR